jgi:2,3-bisphosphoglycerate-independent phosphoglycerate mutase
MNRESLLLMFLDGVGLGPADPGINPFLAAELPNLHSLLEGGHLDASLPPFHGRRASFRPVDATLDVDGNPESATGQAAILSGVNVAKAIGGHYGPKPNPPIREILRKENLPLHIGQAGRKARLLNAYPDSYFEAVNSGRRLHAAIPLAFVLADIPLATEDDLDRGEAVSADFTGRGWRTRLKRPNTPVLSAEEAGKRIVKLALAGGFSMVDHWLPDYAGHYGEMRGAVRLLGVLDRVIGGIVEAMEGTNLTVIFTSDHGNMEDLSIQGHTRNAVPALILGRSEVRKRIADRLKDLCDFAPAILEVMRI